MLKKIIYKLKFYLGFETRESIFKHLPKNGVCAELGVFRGDFSKLILKHNQPAKLYLVDVWWTLFGENYPDWGPYTNFGKLKTKEAFDEVSTKVKGSNHEFYIGDDLQFLKNCQDHYFDWVYIDSSHDYAHTLEELKLLNSKVKPGGLISGHDWKDDVNHPHYGVKKAILEFCEQYHWTVIYNDKHMQWIIKRKG